MKFFISFLSNIWRDINWIYCSAQILWKSSVNRLTDYNLLRRLLRILFTLKDTWEVRRMLCLSDELIERMWKILCASGLLFAKSKELFLSHRISFTEWWQCYWIWHRFDSDCIYKHETRLFKKNYITHTHIDTPSTFLSFKNMLFFLFGNLLKVFGLMDVTQGRTIK